MHLSTFQREVLNQLDSGRWRTLQEIRENIRSHRENTDYQLRWRTLLGLLWEPLGSVSLVSIGSLGRTLDYLTLKKLAEDQIRNDSARTLLDQSGYTRRRWRLTDQGRRERMLQMVHNYRRERLLR